MGCDEGTTTADLKTSCFNPRTHVGCDARVGQRRDGHFQFQSTHPRGVRHENIARAIFRFRVSIHAPTWGATSHSLWNSLRTPCFNPRTHVGCDACRFRRFHKPCRFNPRTHVGCDSFPVTSLECRFLFQSTHPRGVRLPGAWWPSCRNWVSIHAPTWGATRNPCRRRTELRFQSTHPRGVRLISGFFCFIATMFQSTHPRGVRPNLICFPANAPLFQSTHPRGVRPGINNQHLRNFGFQSTHPRGVRLATERFASDFYSFNPRTHVGCDDRAPDEHMKAAKFQSTHPRGVRRRPSTRPECRLRFQSTHPRGVRPGSLDCEHPLQFCFNPRTHVGCDLSGSRPTGRTTVSIHAPTWGATSLILAPSRKQPFQSTHPRGVRPPPPAPYS